MNATKVEINAAALKNNLERIRERNRGKEVMAVVKANAYGHGLDLVAPILAQQGVKHFAVSNLGEAAQIRELLGARSDVLILGRTPAQLAGAVAEGDFIQAVGSVEYARELCAAGSQIRIHVKVDTGMTRTGIGEHSELDEIMDIRPLQTEALFTHFSCADSLEQEDIAFTQHQQAKIVKFADEYKLPYHSQNTGGALNHCQNARFSGKFIRTGLGLYGFGDNGTAGLVPVMSLKSQITHIREVAAGTPVGYGRTYVTDAPAQMPYETESPSWLAVVPVGYADGYSRALSNIGFVMVGGVPCPIRGRVCMEYIIIDVSEIPGAKVGDEVLVYSQESRKTSIEHIAKQLRTIPYEITCAVAGRVPRVLV
ncbi:MAG: alanine racemase [Oscillospiraceae bacterium]|nr:alanine racemase [Oscillospiraceae bacterium]